MKVHSLHRAVEVDAPIDIVFSFFSRPENLPRLTPPSLKMRILTPQPVPMHAGSVIDYLVSVGGLPSRWTSLIADYQSPLRFVDVQLRGPYSFWHHTHSFVDNGRTTIVRDDVVYALPFGLLGAAVHEIFVRRQLDHIFAFRQQYLVGEIQWGEVSI